VCLTLNSYLFKLEALSWVASSPRVRAGVECRVTCTLQTAAAFLWCAVSEPQILRGMRLDDFMNSKNGHIPSLVVSMGTSLVRLFHCDKIPDVNSLRRGKIFLASCLLGGCCTA
jgi:hypothetical protein